MLIAEPERATKYLDKLLEKKIEWYESLFAQTGGCIDMIAEYDDLGTQRGPWISKELFHKFILPRHKELWAEVKRMSPDVKIFLHTCGSVSSLLGDLIDAGLDCLNPIQINADNMDPYYLKREFGKHLTFWGGGVDTQIILPTGTPQQVADNVKRNIDALAPGGGYVFASVHNVQDDVPPENFMAMLEAFRENCNY